MAEVTTVKVENLGKIKGSIMKTIKGNEFLAFRGIPYAEPPTEQLRFKPPIPKSPWLKNNETLDATTEGPGCIQYDMITKSIIGKEDCLTLNVYTGNVNSKQPVLIFIHGGGYSLGSGSSVIYGARRILDHKVVLVTFNYRLHVLGFLSTSDHACPGNFGLLDQVEVLKWVHLHISAFGGDPNRVTIFGESAGSSSVVYHMLSPLSKGLFHGAIAMSGSPICPFAFTSSPDIYLQKLVDVLNFPKCNSVELVELLRKIPARDIVRALPGILKQSGTPFIPTVDGYFLTDSPANLIKNGHIESKVPLMMGITENEGALFYAFTNQSKFLDTSDKTVKRLLQTILNINPDQPGFDQVAKAVKKYYFTGLDTSDEIAIRDKYIEIISDGLVVSAHFETVMDFLRAGLNPFVYSYDYRGNQLLAKLIGCEDIIGATHAEDLLFLFDSSLMDNETLNNPETNKFLQMWINFAMESNPNLKEAGEKVWKPAGSKSIPVFHLAVKNSLDFYNPDQDSARIFWMQKVPSILKKSKETNVKILNKVCMRNKL